MKMCIVWLQLLSPVTPIWCQHEHIYCAQKKNPVTHRTRRFKQNSPNICWCCCYEGVRLLAKAGTTLMKGILRVINKTGMPKSRVKSREYRSVALFVIAKTSNQFLWYPNKYLHLQSVKEWVGLHLTSHFLVAMLIWLSCLFIHNVQHSLLELD